jgi:hypothetical protein
VYIKCLKYPLASIHGRYDPLTRELGPLLFRAFIDPAALRTIERIDTAPLGAAERMHGGQFSVRHRPGSAAIESISLHDQTDGPLDADQGRLCSPERLRMLIDQASAGRISSPWEH